SILTAVLLLMAVGTASAHAAGYWTCKAGHWAAVQNPTHAKPTKPCEPNFQRPGDQATCVKVGGQWGPRGLLRRPICTTPTRDGGRVCADNGECDGSCISKLTPKKRESLKARPKVRALGQCTGTTPVFGCLAFVERGFVNGILCRD
ncbi:MAG: hypothetical protein RLT05_22315, partial [Bauldia litoralis]